MNLLQTHDVWEFVEKDYKKSINEDSLTKAQCVRKIKHGKNKITIKI
jgi:hypothetical protein